MSTTPDTAEQNIQMWKVKKLIKSLDSARGLVMILSTQWIPLLSYIQCWDFHDQSHHPPQGER
jgi:hypothetical protein